MYKVGDVFTGKVKWFGTKGESFGFIALPEGGEVFVHYKHLLDKGQENPKFKTLKKNQEVRGVIAEGHPNPVTGVIGTQAIDVEVVR